MGGRDTGGATRGRATWGRSTWGRATWGRSTWGRATWGRDTVDVVGLACVVVVGGLTVATLRRGDVAVADGGRVADVETGGANCRLYPAGVSQPSSCLGVFIPFSLQNSWTDGKRESKGLVSSGALVDIIGPLPLPGSLYLAFRLTSRGQSRPLNDVSLFLSSRHAYLWCLLTWASAVSSFTNRVVQHSTTQE